MCWPRLSVVTSDLHFVADFTERKSEDIFAALSDEKKSKMGGRYSSILLKILAHANVGE